MKSRNLNVLVSIGILAFYGNFLLEVLLDDMSLEKALAERVTDKSTSKEDCDGDCTSFDEHRHNGVRSND